MGGEAHSSPCKVPNYASFNDIKGIAQLEELEKALAAKGLKDPWIRNEVWRYHPGFGTRWQRARKFFFRGFPLGLGLTVITVGIGKLVGGDGHGHGHGHEGEGH